MGIWGEGLGRYFLRGKDLDEVDELDTPITDVNSMAGLNDNNPDDFVHDDHVLELDDHDVPRLRVPADLSTVKLVHDNSGHVEGQLGATRTATVEVLSYTEMRLRELTEVVAKVRAEHEAWKAKRRQNAKMAWIERRMERRAISAAEAGFAVAGDRISDAPPSGTSASDASPEQIQSGIVQLAADLYMQLDFELPNDLDEPSTMVS